MLVSFSLAAGVIDIFLYEKGFRKLSQLMMLLLPTAVHSSFTSEWVPGHIIHYQETVWSAEEVYVLLTLADIGIWTDAKDDSLSFWSWFSALTWPHL